MAKLAFGQPRGSLALQGAAPEQRFKAWWGSTKMGSWV